MKKSFTGEVLLENLYWRIFSGEVLRLREL